jgi:DNA-directed RNA polymerase specialized sigma subunit, sigma24 homolog
MLIYLSLLDTEEDISKFEEIYNTYKKQMYYTANNILKDSHLAEDAVHNAFLRIINNLEKIQDINSHKTKGLIVIIVKNASIDIYRKNKKKEKYYFIDDLEQLVDMMRLAKIIWGIWRLPYINYLKIISKSFY